MLTGAPSLKSLAVGLEAEASRVQGTLRVPELDLASNLLMCADTLRRLARSASALVMEVIASGGTPPLLAETWAMLDLLGFLATTEMALHSPADAQLRRNVPSVDPNPTPWRAYIRLCDACTIQTTVLPELRRLDLRLVEARNRLLAHRLRGHALAVTTWRRSRRVQISLKPASVDPTADAEVRGIAAGIGAPAAGSPLGLLPLSSMGQALSTGLAVRGSPSRCVRSATSRRIPRSSFADLLRVTGELT